jgi:tRNA (guanine37-N1)-methyltransferase
LDEIFGIKIKKELGFQTIEKLKNTSNFDDSFEIIKEGDFLWLPLFSEIKGAKKKNFSKKKSFPNLQEKFGVRAFDIVGEIIILYLSDSQVPNEIEIGNYLMRQYPNVKAVYRKIGIRKEDTRIQKLKLIAGKGSETTHMENGLKFKLDVTKVFFSPRQITERMDLINYVKKNVSVCVFFSGISPIPIYLASFSEAKRIVAIELNEVAHKYASENARLNKIKNIDLICGDIREIIPKLQEKGLFDLVIMPLPKQSENYLMLANKILRTNGKLILYKVANEEQIEKTIKEIKDEKLILLETKKGINVSPNEWRYMLVTKKSDFLP